VGKLQSLSEGCMKIDLEIPDWSIDDRTLYVFSGIELLAFKPPGEKWKLKNSRCSQCGVCCTKLNRATNTFVSLNSFEGRCIFLRTMPDGKQLCGFGVGRPFGCCIGRDGKEVNPNCTESFEEME
jgi:hypothetical protein